MTNDKAIEVLEYARNYDGMDYGAPSIALDMAISALRQQECVCDVNKSLTLDELREMDGDPVWVVYGEDEGMWALVEVCEESIFLTNNLGGRTEYADDAELEDDGLTVYRHCLYSKEQEYGNLGAIMRKREARLFQV